jgi:hypothetical protein
MYYLPLMPYHNNIASYWNESGRGEKEMFWDWVEEEYNTKIAMRGYPEQWIFEDELDMIVFMLRWA